VNNGASINYATSGGGLVGSKIRITEVTGEGTTPGFPAAGSVVPITGGILNFTSGAFTGTSGGEWVFGMGAPGSITITGSGPGIGSGVLLTGRILEADVTGSKKNFHVAIGAFVNTISSALAAYFGVPAGPGMPWSGNLNIGFTTSGKPIAPGTFNSINVSSGDVITSIPEPSSLAIAGLGGVGLIGYGLRRRRPVGA
jgi:hypothetical protein